MIPQTCHDHAKFKDIVPYQTKFFIFLFFIFIYFLGIKHAWKHLHHKPKLATLQELPPNNHNNIDIFKHAYYSSM